jgi:hypothetical protein
MAPDERIVTYFEELIQRNYKNPPRDYLIYLVVGVRCQMDMGGIQSIFDQLLRDKLTIDFFITGLRQLDEPWLADAFTRAAAQRRVALRESIGEEIRQSNRLWELDEKLCTRIAP